MAHGPGAGFLVANDLRTDKHTLTHNFLWHYVHGR